MKVKTSYPKMVCYHGEPFNYSTDYDQLVNVTMTQKELDTINKHLKEKIDMWYFAQGWQAFFREGLQFQCLTPTRLFGKFFHLDGRFKYDRNTAFKIKIV